MTLNIICCLRCHITSENRSYREASSLKRPLYSFFLQDGVALRLAKEEGKRCQQHLESLLSGGHLDHLWSYRKM
jgi:hypothetical protein